MICTVEHNSNHIQFDTAEGTSLAIPILFTEKYLSAYGVGAPTKKPYAVEGFTGSVHLGGSCNCDVIEMIPHCHTTHTECVGHVLSKPVFAYEALQENLFLSKLITITPDDFKVSAELLRARVKLNGHKALIIRTTPNTDAKKTAQYADKAPYMTKDAVEWCNQHGVEHLLVDFPSMDPIWDGGRLEAHRTFWNLTPEQKEIDSKTWVHKTITELIYVPDLISDGDYVLNLQVSNLQLDASPSTPIIYPVREV